MYLILHKYKKYGLTPSPWQCHPSDYDKWEDYVEDYSIKAMTHEAYQSYTLVQYMMGEMHNLEIINETTWTRPEKKVRIINP